MRHSFSLLFTAATCLDVAFAIPVAAPEPTADLQNRQDDSIMSAIASAVSSQDAAAVISQYASITPTATPTDVSQVLSILSSIYPSVTSESDLYLNVAEKIANGLGPSDDITTINETYSDPTGENSVSNDNAAQPSSCVIYPKKDNSDAPYSISESDLRAAIYIPSTFTYGVKQPMIMVPGTGSYGYLSFGFNLIPLFTDSPYADPVWLNIPDALLLDAQVNAEYIAYAINYINCITNSTASLVTWSQGGLASQWAFKYWPSTRSVVTDFMPVSPDFHGTIFANALCLGLGEGTTDLLSCAPSVIQQEYDSAFITRLRENGGDSAYVPTTTLYSGLFDEIVEPQQGTAASAYLLDARGVGVTNNEIQDLCPLQPAGTFGDHESMLYNPITYYLMVDALTHSGPGEPSRAINSSVCDSFAAPGLGLTGVLGTEGLSVISGVMTLVGEPKVNTEPALMSYATY